MKKHKPIELDFEIDKLTNSIENVRSGDRFMTEISLLTKLEVKMLTTENGWKFSWLKELIPFRQIFGIMTLPCLLWSASSPTTKFSIGEDTNRRGEDYCAK